VPNGLSRGQSRRLLQVDPVRCRLRAIRCVPACRIHGVGHFCLARAAVVNPARAAPLRALGVDRDSGAKQWAAMPRMHKSASRSWLRRGGTRDIGDGPRAERVVERLQGRLLEIEISEIVVHETDEPDAFIDFLDAELLAGQDG
jgi:hypothetical protein